MGRFIWFICCIIIGILLFGLSSVSDNLYCSYQNDTCFFQSKIKLINYVLNEETFLPSEVQSVYCDKQYQPARSGKKVYFILKLQKTDGRIYNLSSYKKYKLCNSDKTPIADFIKHKRQDFTYTSGGGFTNSFGIILAVLMFVIGIVILTTKPEPPDEDDSDDEVSEDVEQ